jgi:hypothetical protein
VLDNKRIDDLAADAALDDAVAQLQINRAAGVSGGAGGCNNSTQATLVTWHDPSAGDIDVQCRIDTTSSVAGYARAVHLEAASGSASITTADVTFYDQPSPSTHTVISITCWNRRQPPCA